MSGKANDRAQDRRDTAWGCALFTFWKGGTIAVIALAVKLKLGFSGAALWFLGWQSIACAAFPDVKRQPRFDIHRDWNATVLRRVSGQPPRLVSSQTR